MPLQTNDKINALFQEFFTKYPGVSISNFEEIPEVSPDAFKLLGDIQYQTLKYNNLLSMTGNKRKDIKELYRIVSLLFMSLIYTSERVTALESSTQTPQE